MSLIKVHEFMTLDGIVETPAWTADFGWDPAMGETIGSLTASCRAILLGRRTYEMFAPAWSTRTVDDDPGAPFFNGTDKYVVSSTLEQANWGPSKVLGGYDPGTLRSLKSSVDGDIYVSGSITLVRAMLSDRLVDELHLFIYPLALGEGLRLFPDGAPGQRLALTASDTYANGVVHLAYAPAAG